MYRNVLVAIDGSPEGEVALRHAIGLARCTNARLTIVAAAPMPSTMGWTGGYAAIGRDELLRPHVAALREAVDLVPDDIPVTTLLREGSLASAVLDLVKQGGHDLVVLGECGRRPAIAARLGGVARVLRTCPVPVLVVQNPPAAEEKSPVGVASGRPARTA